MDDGYTERDYLEQQREEERGESAEPAPAEEPPPASGWETYDYDRVFDETYAAQSAADASSGSDESKASYWDQSGDSGGEHAHPSSGESQSSWGVGSLLSSAYETVTSYVWGSGAPSQDAGPTDEDQEHRRQELEQQRQELEQQRQELQARAAANELDVVAHRAGTMLNDAVGSAGGEIGDMDPGPLFQNMRMDKERAQLEQEHSEVGQQLGEVERQLGELGQKSS
jgi:hypothetical protein